MRRHSTAKISLITLSEKRGPLLFAVSDQMVEWREPDSRKRSSISTADIIHAEKVTVHVVVLTTTSKGSIRIPLTGRSLRRIDKKSRNSSSRSSVSGRRGR